MTIHSDERLPPLDGLRGVAILLVLVYHFGGRLDPSTPLEHAYRRLIALGWSGVDLFFVLSGFLITGILVDARNSSTYVRAFYARRALRILPLYYAFVFGYMGAALPLLFGDAPALTAFTRDLPWFLVFGSNIMISLRDTLAAAPYYTGSLWSLAVEEQFYLWWPLLVAMCPPARLGRACLWVALLSVTFRVLVYRAGFNWGAVYLMPARMDALALGGWVAVQVRSNPALLARTTSVMIVAAGAALSAGWLFSDTFAYSEVGVLRTASLSVFAIFYAGLIGTTLVSPRGGLARVCSGQYLRMFGFYSFGLYIWHNPVRLVLDLIGATPNDLVAKGLPGFAAVVLYSTGATLFSLAAAYVSWVAIERPFNRLKRHLPYTTRPEPATPAVAAAG
ncbi:MAG: acyltransferase family protein [Vicinamibacterales bacterium]